MRTRPVTIADEEILECAKTLREMCAFLEEGIHSYRKILNNVCAYAVKSGDTADAIASFVQETAKISNLYSQLGEYIGLELTNFQTAVSDADPYCICIDGGSYEQN